jgi:hypothetical protein
MERRKPGGPFWGLMGVFGLFSLVDRHPLFILFYFYLLNCLNLFNPRRAMAFSFNPMVKKRQIDIYTNV